MAIETLQKRIAARIGESEGDVFLRADFRDMGGYDQVGRALGALAGSGTLLKFGQGLYVKAQVSPFNGKPAPVVGIKRVAEEAMRRLNIPVVPSTWETEYNNGGTTQVPTGRVIGVRKRVRRRLGYAGVKVTLEKVSQPD